MNKASFLVLALAVMSAAVSSCKKPQLPAPGKPEGATLPTTHEQATEPRAPTPVPTPATTPASPPETAPKATPEATRTPAERDRSS